MFSIASRSFCQSKLEVPCFLVANVSKCKTYTTLEPCWRRNVSIWWVFKSLRSWCTRMQTHSQIHQYRYCKHIASASTVVVLMSVNTLLSSLHLRGACRPHTRYLPIFELIVANVANEHVTRCMGDHLSVRACKLIFLPCFYWQPWYLPKHQSMWKQSSWPRIYRFLEF